MSTPYAAYRAQRYFGSLDALRALSIAMVVWHHTDYAQFGLRITTRGFLGVDVFFVLSGFLIVTLLLRERAASDAISLRRFYARRFLRIFPLYYALVALLGVIAWLRPHGAMSAGYWGDLPYYLTYTVNWIDAATFLGVAWSLSVEEQFYVVWPPLEKWLPGGAVGLLVVGVLASWCITGGYVNEWLGMEPYNTAFLGRAIFAPIMLGALLAHALHNKVWFARLWRVFGWRWSPLVWLAVLVMLFEVLPEELTRWHRPTIHLAMTGLLASLVVREDHVLAPVTHVRWIQRVGVISYGMYLLHMFVEHFTSKAVERMGWDTPGLFFFITFVFTVVAAELSFRFFETPFLKLKQRFSAKTTAPL